MIDLDMISARKLITSASTLPLYLAAAAQTLAIGDDNVTLCPEGIFGNCDQQANADLNTLVGNIVTYLLIAAAIVAVIFLIWGGIKWITSGGDKAKVESARNTIIGAIIGLVLVFASFLILETVLRTLFGVENVQDINPTPITE